MLLPIDTSLTPPCFTPVRLLNLPQLTARRQLRHQPQPQRSTRILIPAALLANPTTTSLPRLPSRLLLLQPLKRLPPRIAIPSLASGPVPPRLACHTRPRLPRLLKRPTMTRSSASAPEPLKAHHTQDQLPHQSAKPLLRLEATNRLYPRP